MGDISRYAEGQQTGVDTATAMVGPAGETTIVVPAGMNFIDRMVISSATDGAALGSAVLGVELTGSGSKNGVQRIIVGGGGAEVTNATHFGVGPREIGPMGIAVQPGNPITVNGWMLGEDSGTTFIGVTFIFSASSSVGSLLWESQEVQATTIDTDIGFQNWGGGATATMPVPTQARSLVAMTACIGGDNAALGSGGAVAIGRGNGFVSEQQVAIGGAGGENITESGFWANAGYIKCNFDVRGGDSISWYGRMTGEDIGTVSCGISCGFKIG
jgi:hypothetical protein